MSGCPECGSTKVISGITRWKCTKCDHEWDPDNSVKISSDMPPKRRIYINPATGNMLFMDGDEEASYDDVEDGKFNDAEGIQTMKTVEELREEFGLL